MAIAEEDRVTGIKYDTKGQHQPRTRGAEQTHLSHIHDCSIVACDNYARMPSTSLPKDISSLPLTKSGMPYARQTGCNVSLSGGTRGARSSNSVEF